MLTGNESVEDLFELLYQAQMRMLREECERFFTPLGDVVKDEDWTDDYAVA